MLSRVQSLEQLFILGCVPPGKLYPNAKALRELERLDKISINRNPPIWELNGDGNLRIFSLNCQSLRGKMDHMRYDKILGKSDIICLSETWLLTDEFAENLQIEGFMLQLNSVAFGKGLATYFRPEVFKHCEDVIETHFQLTKMESPEFDVISVYRSQDGNSNHLVENILKIIDLEKSTVICGDINICYKADRNNEFIKNLEELGFHQHVRDATHLKGGLIDHVYVRQCKNPVSIDCSLYSPYYCAMDHDALLTTVSLRNEVE